MVKEATTRFELVIRVLQTHALPLGYVAILLNYASLQVTPTGIEPVLPPWKGDVLTAWPRSLIFKKTPRVGLEPTTSRLTAVRSTIELSRNISFASFRMSFVHSKLHTKSEKSNILESRSSRFRFASSRWFCYAKLRLYQVPYPQTSLLHATSYILPSFSALVKPSID